MLVRARVCVWVGTLYHCLPGSVSRLWYTHTVDGTRIKPEQCWSPRLSYVLGKFRVMWHQNGKFMVAEAIKAAGPWHLVKNNLTHMESPWSV